METVRARAMISFKEIASVNKMAVDWVTEYPHMHLRVEHSLEHDDTISGV